MVSLQATTLLKIDFATNVLLAWFSETFFIGFARDNFSCMFYLRWFNWQSVLIEWNYFWKKIYIFDLVQTLSKIFVNRLSRKLLDSHINELHLKVSVLVFCQQYRGILFTDVTLRCKGHPPLKINMLAVLMVMFKLYINMKFDFGPDDPCETQPWSKKSENL